MKIKTVINGKTIEERELSQIEIEERRKAQEKYKKTHPEGAPRISGCCDHPPGLGYGGE